jgi:hypothetical protein
MTRPLRHFEPASFDGGHGYYQPIEQKKSTESGENDNWDKGSKGNGRGKDLNFILVFRNSGYPLKLNLPFIEAFFEAQRNFRPSAPEKGGAALPGGGILGKQSGGGDNSLPVSAIDS